MSAQSQFVDEIVGFIFEATELNPRLTADGIVDGLPPAELQRRRAYLSSRDFAIEVMAAIRCLLDLGRPPYADNETALAALRGRSSKPPDGIKFGPGAAALAAHFLGRDETAHLDRPRSPAAREISAVIQHLEREGRDVTPLRHLDLRARSVAGGGQ